jgi:hypothetical protein
LYGAYITEDTIDKCISDLQEQRLAKVVNNNTEILSFSDEEIGVCLLESLWQTQCEIYTQH